MYPIEAMTEDGRILMNPIQFGNFVKAQQVVTFNVSSDTVYAVYNGIVIEMIE